MVLSSWDLTESEHRKRFREQYSTVRASSLSVLSVRYLTESYWVCSWPYTAHTHARKYRWSLCHRFSNFSNDAASYASLTSTFSRSRPASTANNVQSAQRSTPSDIERRLAPTNSRTSAVWRFVFRSILSWRLFWAFSYLSCSYLQQFHDYVGPSFWFQQFYQMRLWTFQGRIPILFSF